MPDYGHPLAFGTFLTPANDPPQSAVALAQLSEELGFDLVTFQDHPYQPSFLDTWTLMSFVAARTERIDISANVLNLPLRQPAVLARSAASLDLLSNGRLALGLGAGAFWDAIEAMGGPRRTPGEAVDALSEAMDVIRGIWDAGNRAPLRVAGEHYSVNGAKRGPAPAHDIPIWLGAYKPRMLRLTGRKADGWLPSLPYMKPGDIERSNATIDQSAAAAGRDPREIRRLLNITGRFATARGEALDGPAEQWVEKLTRLALENGFSTFILGSDDPATLQRFAVEVMPAVRDVVERERGDRGTVSSTVRRADARAQRRDGIDYDALPLSLAAAAVEPGDSGYARVRSTYIRGGSPGLVLRPGTVSEVSEALAFARAQPVELAIRSGGHGFSGRSTNDGGIVIDLSALNTIEIIDEATRRIRVGPGARWSAVAAAIAPRGWALSSGDYGGVGVGGLATAGGIGWFAREHGLTIDHLVSAEIVLADGSLIPADSTQNPDLFWAIRGAGANFGIVVSFEFEVDLQPNDVGWAQLALDASDAASVLERWGAAVEASPRDVTASLLLGSTAPGRQAVAQIMAVVDSDNPETIISRLQPLADVAPLLDQSVQLMPYAAVMANDAGAGVHNGRGEPLSRSGLIEHITPEFAAASARMLESGAFYWYQLRSVGGAVSDVDADATAYGNRSANFSLVAIGGDKERLDAAWAELYDHFSGLYLSFETGLHEGRIADAFPPKTIARLRELKTRYDPENVFRDNFNIEVPA
jgi:alkanesulfonate monooxygenase SsuD/methylene tetrahydromethanopterin reductase-like flavin-dependent oxidoreductase (luciferase family)/FAD/FMN-containing dehydrogenase